ncbi:MAG: hypothetical protein WBV46_07755 [Terriglobales bacterium]
MKLRLIAVLAVLALGTVASAQTFGFASVGGGEYCNYEQLVNNGDDVWSGVDNNIDVCYAGLGLSYNGAIAGFTAALPNAGLPVHGAGVDYGDSTYEAQEADIDEYYADLGYGNLGYFSTDEWTVHTALKCNKQNPNTGAYKGAYSWIGVAGSSFGFYFGDNYGFLSCSIPAKGDKAAAKLGPSFGKSKSAVKTQMKLKSTK